MAASYARVFYPFTISEKDYRLFSAAQNMVALRHGAKDTIFDFSAAYDGIFFCFFSFLTHTLTQNGKKYTETAEPSLPESSRFCMQCCPKWPEMVNCAILKQLITRRSQVQVLPPQPENPEISTVSGFFLCSIAICISFSRRALPHFFIKYYPSYKISPLSFYFNFSARPLLAFAVK